MDTATSAWAGGQQRVGAVGIAAASLTVPGKVRPTSMGRPIIAPNLLRIHTPRGTAHSRASHRPPCRAAARRRSGPSLRGPKARPQSLSPPPLPPRPRSRLPRPQRQAPPPRAAAAVHGAGDAVRTCGTLGMLAPRSATSLKPAQRMSHNRGCSRVSGETQTSLEVALMGCTLREVLPPSPPRSPRRPPPPSWLSAAASPVPAREGQRSGQHPHWPSGTHTCRARPPNMQHFVPEVGGQARHRPPLPVNRLPPSLHALALRPRRVTRPDGRHADLGWAALGGAGTLALPGRSLFLFSRLLRQAKQKGVCALQLPPGVPQQHQTARLSRRRGGGHRRRGRVRPAGQQEMLAAAIPPRRHAIQPPPPGEAERRMQGGRAAGGRTAPHLALLGGRPLLLCLLLGLLLRGLHSGGSRARCAGGAPMLGCRRPGHAREGAAANVAPFGPRGVACVARGWRGRGAAHLGGQVDIRGCARLGEELQDALHLGSLQRRGRGRCAG